ncbi:MAG TPA: DUF1810 domain-containing protein [Roseateles sp.]
MSTVDRFVSAQQDHYAQALAELRAGRKTGHWIWFVLPQLRGLGRSAMAQTYGIADRTEAEAYLAHPLLGARLVECVAALLAHAALSADDILGAIDAMKTRSCLTLFEAVASDERRHLFAQALERFYAGQRDEATLALLQDKQKAGASRHRPC